MNKALFSSMKAQLSPSPRAMAALTDRLEQGTTPRKSFPWGRCVAVAACAALLLAAYPVYRTLNPAPKLHSYVTAGDAPTLNPVTTAEGGTVDWGTGTAGPNTGVLPGVAQTGEAVTAYQNLMARFKAEYGDGYPDWYGGSYITTPEAEGGGATLSGVLVVNLVRPYGETKDAALQVYEWASTYAVVFGDCKYSYSDLLDLRTQVEALPRLKELSSWGCGVDEQFNQVTLDVPQVDDALLADLARLDPDDDAILVRVSGMMTTQDDEPLRPIVPAGDQPLDGEDQVIGEDKAVAPSISSDADSPVENDPSKTEDAQQAKEPVIEDLNEGDVAEPAVD